MCIWICMCSYLLRCKDDKYIFTRSKGDIFKGEDNEKVIHIYSNVHTFTIYWHEYRSSLVVLCFAIIAGFVLATN